MRNVLSGTLLSGITLCVLLVLLEIVLRFTGSYARDPILFDPILGYVPKPNADVRTKTPEYDTLRHITSEGFWGKEYPHEKPAGVTRIIVLGDSFTQGLQVPREGTYAELLETGLRAVGKNVEVVNLGRGGYGTAKENYVLNRFGLAYEPDVVVVGFFLGNDIMNNLSEQGFDEKSPQAASRKQGAKIFLINNSAVVRFVLEQKARNKILAWLRGDLREESGHIISTDMHPYFKELPDDAREAYALTETELLEMRRAAEEHGAKLFVFLIPYREQVHERFRLLEDDAVIDYDQPNRILATFMDEQDFDYIDLLPRFRAWVKEHPGELLYGTLDSHYNAAGQRETARILMDYFAKNL